MLDLSIIKGFLPNWADYIVYAAIIIVTVIGIFKCLIPLWRTTHALRKAVRRLERDDGHGDKPVWQETRFMGSRLKGSWMRFLQNAEQLDRRGLPCNVEDYINDDTVTHGPGNAQLAEMIPSLLTSLGILGTFIGLMRGLTGLDMSDAEALMNGIPVLLDGMKGAFGTSVLGISCSLIFNMCCKIAQGSSYHAIDRFVDSFTDLAMQRPLDNDVQLICQNQDRNHMLFNATDGLASQVAGSIEVAVSRAMQPVARSMDEFLVGATRAQVDGVGRIVNNFIDQMNRSLDQQFLSLGRTLTEVNRNQQDALEKIKASLASADMIIEQAQTLRSVSDEITARFEKYIATISEARQRDEGFEASTAAMLTKLNDAAANQHNALAGLNEYQLRMAKSMEDFRVAVNESIAQMHNADERSVQNFARTGTAIHDASEHLADSYQYFVSNVVDGFSRALGTFNVSMSRMIAELSEQITHASASSTSGAAAAQLSEIQRLLTSVEKTINKGTNTAKED